MSAVTETLTRALAGIAEARWDRVAARWRTKGRASGVPFHCADSEYVLREALTSTAPLMVVRVGLNELRFIHSYALQQRPDHDETAVAWRNMCRSAGVFPDDPDGMDDFLLAYKRALDRVDYLGVYLSTHLRVRAIERFPFLPAGLSAARSLGAGPRFLELDLHAAFCPDASLIAADYPVVWDGASTGMPWTAALRGRRVLVVHPFKASIEQQYHTNRARLFANPDILPEFAELTVVKAVQSQVGHHPHEFATWFDALEFMKRQIDATDYDVALLAAGAYAVPLAAYIRGCGKKAIALGGTLQLLFGIKGRRWEIEMPHIGRALFNEYWIRPKPHEHPPGYLAIEEGCYW